MIDYCLYEYFGEAIFFFLLLFLHVYIIQAYLNKY